MQQLTANSSVSLLSNKQCFVSKKKQLRPRENNAGLPYPYLRNMLIFEIKWKEKFRN